MTSMMDRFAANEFRPVEVARLVRRGVLRVSNCWALTGGRVDEWLNNYGIFIEQDENVYRLTCSDGFGSALTLGDLVVQIEHVRGEGG